MSNAVRSPGGEEVQHLHLGFIESHALYWGAALVVERAGRCVCNANVIEPGPADFCGGDVGRLWWNSPWVKTG